MLASYWVLALTLDRYLRVTRWEFYPIVSMEGHKSSYSRYGTITVNNAGKGTWCAIAERYYHFTSTRQRLNIAPSPVPVPVPLISRSQLLYPLRRVSSVAEYLLTLHFS
jgi:hypothetical protein